MPIKRIRSLPFYTLLPPAGEGRKRLLLWYAGHARDLPWRRQANAYRIWISEVMLQQTQVKTVLPYYRRFMQTFPNVKRLAQAKADKVLKLWEGLGYYRRAHALQQTAKIITRQFQGHFPTQAEAWLKFPGIGRSTANAIVSIAFQQAVPVLDGNIKRVLARLLAWQGKVDQPDTERMFWKIAEQLLAVEAPGDFNQALMELGATVCTPQTPACSICPWRIFCAAYGLGRVEDFPAYSPRKKIPHRQLVAAIILKQGRCLLVKRPAQGLLGGLWELPAGKVNPGEKPRAALEGVLSQELKISLQASGLLTKVKHAFSHFSFTLSVYQCQLLQGRPQARRYEKIRWVLPSQMPHYAFSRAHQKVLEQLGWIKSHSHF